jgi:hypothetical protein
MLVILLTLSEFEAGMVLGLRASRHAKAEAEARGVELEDVVTDPAWLARFRADLDPALVPLLDQPGMHGMLCASIGIADRNRDTLDGLREQFEEAVEGLEAPAH